MSRSLSSSSFEWNRAVRLVERLKATRGKDKSKVFDEIWKLTEEDENKLIFAEASIGFLPIVRDVLEKVDLDCLKSALNCLWYMSRVNSNRLLFGNRATGLVAAIMRLTRSQPRYASNYFSFFVNVCLVPQVHDYLLSDEVGCVQYYLDSIVASPEDFVGYRFFGNLTSCISNAHVKKLTDRDIHRKIINRLTASGGDPTKWSKDGRLGGVEYWCLSFVLGLTTLPNGIEAIRSIGGSNVSRFFYQMLSCPDIEGIKAACIVANLYGKQESNAVTKALLESYPGIFPLLEDVFAATINENKGIEVTRLDTRGFTFGIITLNILVDACKNLSISDCNKAVMIQSNVLRRCIYRTIELFVLNSPQLQAKVDDRFSYAGGGGEDYPSVVSAVELLLQLSFAYDDHHQMRQAFCQFSMNFEQLLNELIALPSAREVPMEAKNFARQFLMKLNAPTRIPSTLASISATVPSRSRSFPSIGLPQHIMISYAWGANKSHVVSLSQKLKELGYDVWRDEEGSSLVPPMSGDIVETMREAIQYSHTIIICVSPDYKESANCRAEADYAKVQQQSQGLKIVYVLMKEEYTRAAVSGWLSDMIGSNNYYPLWNVSHITSTAQCIAAIVGNNARKTANAQIIAQLQGSPNAIVPTASTISSISELSTTLESTTLSEASSDLKIRANDPPPPPAVVKGKDLPKAWELLQDPKRVLDMKSMADALEELGIYGEEDLEHLPVDLATTILHQLKPAAKHRFAALMNFTI